MINSIDDIRLTGDAVEFVEDNIEYLKRIEQAISLLFPSSDNPYQSAARCLECHVKEYKQLPHQYNRMRAIYPWLYE